MDEQGAQPITPGQEKKGGCLKWLLIGCGVLVVIAIILVVLGFIFGPKLAMWGLGKLKEPVVAALPVEDKDEAQERFQQFFEDLMSDQVDQAKAQEIIGGIQAALADQTVSEEEAQEILDKLRALQGAPPALEEMTPEESEGP